MKTIRLFPLAMLVIALASTSQAKTAVQIQDTKGRPVGTAILWESAPGIGMELNLENLPAGEHAIHFHQNAKCEAPEDVYKRQLRYSRVCDRPGWYLSGTPGTEPGPRVASAELLQSLEPGPHKVLSPKANKWRRRSTGQRMTAKASPRVDASEDLPSASLILSPRDSGRLRESFDMVTSATLQGQLLDFSAWSEILTTYGRTMKVAVALTDSQGQILGKCHNAQPVWQLVHDAARSWGSGCPFCLTTHVPCTAVAEALQTGCLLYTSRCV